MIIMILKKQLVLINFGKCQANIKQFRTFISNFESGEPLLHFLYKDSNELCKYIFMSGNVFLIDFF